MENSSGAVEASKTVGKAIDRYAARLGGKGELARKALISEQSVREMTAGNIDRFTRDEMEKAIIACGLSHYFSGMIDQIKPLANVANVPKGNSQEEQLHSAN